MGFIIGVQKDGFMDVGSFEDDLYTSMLEDSFKFLTEARIFWNRDEDIFIDF